MIRFQFNEAKATQAAALLLKENGGKMNYMKLIKLLYLADRKALSLWERPITGDAYVSMDKGPVLSRVLDKINSGKEPHTVSYWHKYISSPETYKIKLKHEPIFDELSKRERGLLIGIFQEYGQYDQWQLVDICHEILPEWADPRGTSIPIQIEDILRAVNKTMRDIALIEDEVSHINYVRAILSRDS
jgi:uncharacterized phage-associated protein